MVQNTGAEETLIRESARCAARFVAAVVIARRFFLPVRQGQGGTAPA